MLRPIHLCFLRAARCRRLFLSLDLFLNVALSVLAGSHDLQPQQSIQIATRCQIELLRTVALWHARTCRRLQSRRLVPDREAKVLTQPPRARLSETKC